MLRISFLLIFNFVLVISATAQVKIHDLVGRWKMYRVYRGNAEITNEYLPDADRWIEFNMDHTFVSNGKTYRRIAGTFTLDERNGLLSFDTDLGFGEKSYWHVEYDGEKMIWKDRGNPMIDQIKVILEPKY